MGEKLWHFETMSFWIDGNPDNECTQWWEISPFGGPSQEQRYVGEGPFRRPMTLIVLADRPRDLPETYVPAAHPLTRINGEFYPWHAATPEERSEP